MLEVLDVAFSVWWMYFALPSPSLLLACLCILATPTIECIINKWTFVHKVLELHWVTLENNVHTDKIEGILELTDHSESPFGLDTKEIDYPSRFMGSN